MRTRQLIIVFCALIAICTDARADSTHIAEFNLKAAYIYHFLQFTEWPRHDLPGKDPLNICIDPNNPMVPALAAIENKPVNGKPVLLKAAPWTIRDHCQVLIVNGGDQSAINKNLLAQTHTLTISDDPGISLADAIVVMRIDDGRLVFSINNTQALAFGLTISSRLLRLAETVE